MFPQQAGTLTIGPVTFEAMVIPDRGFSRVQRFRSDVLELDVQPAVAPPAALAGAAWLPAQRVTLTEQWSEPGDELAVGIPRTRTIVVEGVGLARDAAARRAARARSPAFGSTPIGPSSRAKSRPRASSRARSVSYAVIAQTPGEVTLAGVQLPWWNVAEQRWEVAELPPRVLRVSAERRRRRAACPQPRTPVAATGSRRGARARYWPWVSGVLGAAWLATRRALVASRPRERAARSGSSTAPQADSKPALRKILRDLDSACAVGDAAGARDALLAVRRGAVRAEPAAQPRRVGGTVAGGRRARGARARGAHLRGGRRRLARRRARKPCSASSKAPATAPKPGPAEPLLPLYR